MNDSDDDRRHDIALFRYGVSMAVQTRPSSVNSAVDRQRGW
jgi:hypothetical protein